jgi:hypothetical protein
MSSIPTISISTISIPTIIECVDCKKTKSGTIRLFICSTELNPRGENFILCSECTSDEQLDYDTVILSELT